MNVSVGAVLGMAVVAILSTAVGAGSAYAATRLAVRTRFFAMHERFGDTWHGRPVRQADREFEDGLNPAPVAFVTFWIAFTLTLTALDGSFIG